MTNNQLGAGIEPPELNELLPDDIEVYSGVTDVADRLARVADRADPSGARRPWMARTVARIAAGRFETARCRGFLDTDEIRGLVAMAYGVGLHVRREHPGLAALWVLGGSDEDGA